MNVLDENIVAQQCQRLEHWRIPFRQIGRHLSTRGALDENLIPLLHRLPQPTFFTHDEDFFKASLCNARYALVYLDAVDTEAAELVKGSVLSIDNSPASVPTGFQVSYQY